MMRRWLMVGLYACVFAKVSVIGAYDQCISVPINATGTAAAGQAGVDDQQLQIFGNFGHRSARPGSVIVVEQIASSLVRRRILTFSRR